MRGYMKICWDNLNRVKYNKETNKWYTSPSTAYVYKESCDYCHQPFLCLVRYSKNDKNFCDRHCSQMGENNHLYGKKLSEERKKLSALKGNKNPSWKGGITKLNLVFYDTYAPQIEFCEEVRRFKSNKNILEVKCTYCGKWFLPTYKQICNRISGIKSETLLENRLYCSDGCKNACPIYRRVKYPRDFKQGTSREVQPQLRQIVLERDNYTCQECGKTIDEIELHCHHIIPLNESPIESADIDVCITLCKDCHKKKHKIPGCGYYELRC